MEGPLPSGWEVKFDQYGRKYFVDHKNRLVYFVEKIIFEKDLNSIINY